MNRILPALFVAFLLLPACTTGSRRAPAPTSATSGPEVALTLRPASFTPIQGWRMVQAPSTAAGRVYIGADALLTEADVTTASVINDHDGEPALRLDFDDEGARRLYDYSQANLNQPVAFFIDHELVSVPIINAPMSQSAIINASLSRFEAQRVADALTR